MTTTNNNSKLASSHHNQTQPSSTEQKETVQIKPPALSLPKGGGAIKGIGEKFAANPVTGTGSMTIPIATSPGRSGFGPQLSLSYDSGSGNGPFGLGWSLSLPSVTRKTDKGLPKYEDEIESDVFILSGAEDLVPVLVKDGDSWIPEPVNNALIGDNEYSIKRYRPRTEGLFARIEKWTNTKDSNDIIWRSISKDNITTWYGKTEKSRIQQTKNNTTRIFCWMIYESYDDKGNAIVYEYVNENSENVDVNKVNEKNRTADLRQINRYLKRIKYGNKISRLVEPDLSKTEWMFEVVFDYLHENSEDNLAFYGQHFKVEKADDNGQIFINEANLQSQRNWGSRLDPFSSYRAGYEVRTYRLCHRVLMFHHFPDELGVNDYLVRSTEFNYEESNVASFIANVVQSGYKRQDNGKYLKKSLPPVEFEYSKAKISSEIKTLEKDSYENLPIGVDGRQYQFVDLDGEGLSGILTEQGEGWFYKPNLGDGKFGHLQSVKTKPSSGSLAGGQQLLDLAGDGQLDLVSFQEPFQGFFERTDSDDWNSFKNFKTIPNINWKDPNLKFVDLNGDGHADVFITEDEVFRWYPSLAEDGFAEAKQLRKTFDEENGPAVILADGTQSIYLSDMSGDGLTDLVRIRNGEVCYWPNLGYGQFGAKVTMDKSPYFESLDMFDQSRIRLADIDGSGNTDIIYLKGDGVYIYLNESGNSWKEECKLDAFPQVDNLSTVIAADLLGNGTACLVWSSPLPGNAYAPLQYIDLMGGQKPHLLTKTINNLGAETNVHYSASTKFYLKDREEGKSWITKIPFPVHVVEKVETYDKISKNLFTTKYAYHHGYFDGVNREFRGFGMVEQWDTEDFDSLKNNSYKENPDNIDETTHLPPVHTKTWFHTGAYLKGDKISRQFEKEYLREPGRTDDEHQELLLPDTILPSGLTVKEEKEACRALKGSILRQEIYTDDISEKAQFPYSVSERNYTIKKLQAINENKHGVFFVHARETIDFHYERNPSDPRISHQLTLEVDDFGNVNKSVAIGYGRRKRIITVDEHNNRKIIDNPELNQLSVDDQKKQTQILITYTEADYTNAINNDSDNWRTPLPCEVRTYELTGLSPDAHERFSWQELSDLDYTQISEIPYENNASGNQPQKRVIEKVRTLYLKDDLSGPLPTCSLEKLALPYETYKQAYTPGLLNKIYGSKLSEHQLKTILEQEGKYLDLDEDGNYWSPSGRQVFDTTQYYLPKEFIDPFGHNYQISYDKYVLLMKSTSDPLGNSVQALNDYRVMQASILTDPNGNRSQVQFDAMGMVCGTAIMGKESENLGDKFVNFKTDLTNQEIIDFLADPKGDKAVELLDGATTRIIYDLDCYRKDNDKKKPSYSASIVREKHVSDLETEEIPGIQVSFSYSDGFGREIQKKIQAEQGKVPNRDGEGNIIIESNGQPEMIDNPNPYRWVGNGWTIFNNKGKPVRQYEPYFSDSFEYEYNVRIGVSPILIYDQAERVIATLHPNHTYEKVVFDAWKQTSYDVNDNVLNQPDNDVAISGFLRGIDTEEYLPTWYKIRTDDNLAIEKWPDAENPKNSDIRKREKQAALKAAKHTETTSTAYFDSLGRTFLTVEHNRYDKKQNGSTSTINEKYQTRVEMDIEGNQRKIIDAKGRLVIIYDYDMLSANIHQHSMEDGERWMLNNVSGNPMYLWNSRDFRTHTEYDQLNRPLQVYLQENGQPEIMVERLVYGENHIDADLNLRTRLYQHYDQSGVVTNVKFDFKGNPLEGERQFANIYKEYINWIALKDIDDIDQIKTNAAPFLEDEEFTSLTRYDALNRPIQLITPHTPDIKPNIIQPCYNEANLLEKTDVWIRNNSTPSNLLDTDTASQHIVTNIDYDAKGQREKIEYGNQTQTIYQYEFDTYRLHNMHTTRKTDGVIIESMQDILYTYDPTGNITHIQDDAQQILYFKNQIIEPHNDYVYDAIYRLIEATGREHVGQTSGTKNSPAQPNRDDSFRINQPHPHDGNAMDRYTEKYEYDPLGNVLKMFHEASQGGWKRFYQYTEASLLQPANKSNRLSATSLPGDNETGPYHAKYTYDEHGNITTMPHLPLMKWDYNDQLWASSKQVVNNGSAPETTWYVYDNTGQRVRKITESQAEADGTPKKTKERYYLGAFEIYKEYDIDENRTLERESLSVMDSKSRVTLIETKTYEVNLMRRIRNLVTSPLPLYRFQYSNHLGSASLELDEQAAFISYEEYYPYGNTSFHSVDSTSEVPAKRYRYTGKERDNETGLDYYGARYYASWLGRWCSSDPNGLDGGINSYNFVKNNPINKIDPFGLSDEDTLAREASKALNNVKYLSDENRQNAALYEAKGGRIIRSSGRSYNHIESLRQQADKLQKRIRRFQNQLDYLKTHGKKSLSEKLIRNMSDIIKRGRIALSQYHELDKSITSIKNDPIESTRFAGERLLAQGRKGPSVKYIAELARTGLLKAPSTIGGVIKQTIKSFIPGAELWDAAKVVGGGSAIEGARIMSAYALNQASAGVKTAGGAIANAARTTGGAIANAARTTGGAIANAARTTGGAIANAARTTGGALTSAARTAGTILTTDVAAGSVATGAVTTGAIVGAVGSVALAGATIHSAVTGEKTPIEVADEFYGTSFGDLLPEQTADENIYDKAHQYLGWTGLF